MTFKKVFYVLILTFSFASLDIAAARSEVAKITPAQEETAKDETANQNPYVINNVFAFGKEKDSAVSRAKAISQANRSAFILLLDNLGVDNSFEKSVHDEEIDDLIYARQIKDEKIAGTYYSAKFNIEFSKNAVRDILNLKGESTIANPEISKELYILFPVEISAEKTILWEKTNLWRKNIENFLLTNNVKTIIAPVDEDIDLADVDLKNDKESDFAHFTSVIYKYAAKGAIIAYYELDEIENKANITLKTIEFPEVKRIRLSFINSENLDEGSLMSESAQRTMNYIIQNNRKSEIKIKYSPDEEINLNVEITDLENWLMIEDRLRDLPFVRDLKLLSISKNIARITLISNGDNANIVKLFAQHNFSLKRENGEYLLTPAKQE